MHHCRSKTLVTLEIINVSSVSVNFDRHVACRTALKPKARPSVLIRGRVGPKSIPAAPRKEQTMKLQRVETITRDRDSHVASAHSITSVTYENIRPS